MSGSTFQVYKPLHPPTGVEHAVSAHFTTASRWNVCLARTSLLEVFDVREGAGGQQVLDLVASFPLFGNIETMHVVRLGGLDALLLSFREAKLSLVAFDPAEHRLRTLFMYDFEPGSPGGGAKAKAGICDQLNGLADVQLVRVDPDSHCAVMTLCDTHLAVLPFKQGATAVSRAADAAAAAARADSVNNVAAHPPFVLALADIGIEGFVKDMAFLGGFFEPTLLVLHELERTCSGRLSRRANTCAVTAISFALSRQTHTRIWWQAGLPADCAVLRAVPAALGGAVVLSTNALLYVNKASRCVLALNDYARATVDVHRLGSLQPQNVGNSGKDSGAEPITLDAARCAFLADDRLLISARTGHLFLATLLCKGGGGGHQVSSLALSRLGSSVLCTCICAMPELQLFLLGSRLADSQLIAYEARDMAPPPTPKRELAEGGAEGLAALFRAIDKNGDGMVTRIELLLALRKDRGLADRLALPQHVRQEGSTRAMFERVFAEIDADGSETVTLAEFTAYFEREGVTDGAEGGTDGSEGGTAARPAKRSKVAAPASSEDDDLYGDDDASASAPAAAAASPAGAAAATANDEDDDDLYGDDAVTAVGGTGAGAAGRSGSALGARAAGRAWVPTFHESPYTLRPCYSLYNIGPIGDVAIGESAAADEDDEEEEEGGGGATAPDPDAPRRLELVTCSGSGKNSSLAVIRRGLRYELTVEVELPDLEVADSHVRAKGMWAVRSGGEHGGEHAFLILSGKTMSPAAAAAADSASSSAREKEGARGETTRVLYTREGLVEVADEYEEHGFFTAGPTLVAGNLGGAARNLIVQVFPDGARVLDGPTAVQEIPRVADLDVGGMAVSDDVRILAACIDDPFVLLRLSDGTLRLLEVEESVDVVASVPDMPRAGGAVVAACLFRDTSHFLAELLVARDPAKSAAAAPPMPNAGGSVWGSGAATAIALDDDDDLYADDQGSAAAAIPTEPAPKEEEAATADAPIRTFCSVCRESGTFEIYTVPDFVKVFSAPRLPAGPTVLQSTLRQAGGGIGGGDGGAGEDADASNEGVLPDVSEMAMHRVGPTGSALCRCVLAVCCDSGDMYVYQLCHADASLGILPFFSREQTGVVTHHRQSKVAAAAAAVASGHRRHFRYPRLTCFDNVAARSGMLYCGSQQPVWLLCDGGRLQTSPMGLGFDGHRVLKDGKPPVVCFTPLNSEALCEDGFAYFHQSGMMRICKQPGAGSKSANSLGGGPLVVTKSKIGCTTRNILYIGRVGTGGVREALEVPTYAVVVSVPATAPGKAEFVPVEEGGMQDPNVVFDSRPQLLSPDEEFTPELPYEHHEIRLVQSGGWETCFTFPLGEQEEVLTMKLVMLRDAPPRQSGSSGGGGMRGGRYPQQNQRQQYGQRQGQQYNQRQGQQQWGGAAGGGGSGGGGGGGVQKPYLVVGTGTLSFDGEDAQGRGRLLLFALDFGQYTEAGGGVTMKKPKLRLVHEQPTKSHVSCAAQLLDFVVVSEGRQLFVYEWVPLPGGGAGDLRACGFYDMTFYPVSLSVVKHFLLVGDVYKSVQLLRWRADQKNLVLVARDDNDLPVYASEFVADEKTLAFLVADEFKNTFVFGYAPQDSKSENGKKLLCCADFHLGAHVTQMVRQRSIVVEPLDGNPKREHSYVTVLGTLDGGLGMLLPVDEKVFRRLFLLQQIMLNALEHNAGLNPMAFR